MSTTGFRVRHEDIRRRRARDKRSYCYGLTIIRAFAIKIYPFEEICLRRGKLSFEITLPLSLSLSLFNGEEKNLETPFSLRKI